MRKLEKKLKRCEAAALKQSKPFDKALLFYNNDVLCTTCSGSSSTTADSKGTKKRVKRVAMDTDQQSSVQWMEEAAAMSVNDADTSSPVLLGLLTANNNKRPKKDDATRMYTESCAFHGLTHYEQTAY